MYIFIINRVLLRGILHRVVRPEAPSPRASVTGADAHVREALGLSRGQSFFFSPQGSAHHLLKYSARTRSETRNPEPHVQEVHAATTGFVTPHT